MRLFLPIFLCSLASSQSTLQFVQIWFRHGERLPTHYLQLEEGDTSTAYLEIGEPGELTNRGVDQEYRLGQFLRKRYGHFLGPYKPNEIQVFTGVDNRTVVSSQAVMAGLFPPDADRIWNKNLLWQPVSMHTDPSIDWVSTGIDVCSTYKNNLFSSPAFRDIPNRVDQSALSFIREKSGGRPANDVIDINDFVDSLDVRIHLNDSRLPFPDWAEPVRRKIPLLHFQLHDLVLDLENVTVGGYHVEKILAYMADHLQRPASKKNKAVFLGAHDTNLLAITKVLNLLGTPRVLAAFSSHLAIELHLIDGQHEFFFANGVDSNLTEIQMVYCGNPCTLERIQSLVEGHRVSNAEMLKVCMNVGPLKGPSGWLTGTLIGLTAIFIVTTVIFGCTCHSYKRQLRELNDPERTHLLR